MSRNTGTGLSEISKSEHDSGEASMSIPGGGLGEGRIPTSSTFDSGEHGCEEREEGLVLPDKGSVF